VHPKVGDSVIITDKQLIKIRESKGETIHQGIVKFITDNTLVAISILGSIEVARIHQIAILS
jgi:hypothetical protein